MPRTSVQRPRRLKKGATVAVIAPSSFPDYPEFSLFEGLEYIRKLGFRLKIGKTLTEAKSRWYLSGEDEFRAQDINTAFADENVDAIICARGGAGSMRILKLLDYDLIKKNPKPFVGYSDTTSIQNAMLSLSGLASIQGPMGAVGFGKDSDVKKTKMYWNTLVSMLGGEELQLGAWKGGPPPLTVKAGRAEGRLVGGNLILFTLLGGSKYCPTQNGDVLFLEDISEETWRVDNFLASLSAQGALDRASGIVLGEFPREREQARGPRLEEIFRTYLENLDAPSFINYPCCHGYGHEPVPLGIRVSLDADKRLLQMLEAAVE